MTELPFPSRADAAGSRLIAVLGPTNTGKTYLAIERMLGHASGMIGFPLRLLARENYDRVVKLVGAHKVALITGEEKIIPPKPVLFPLHRRIDAARPAGAFHGHRRDPDGGRSRARPFLHRPAAQRARHGRDHAAGRRHDQAAADAAGAGCGIYLPHALLDLELHRPEETDPPAAPLGRGGFLCGRSLWHRRADPSPARRGGGGDGRALARAPATPRWRCSSRARSTTSSPPMRSAWA